MSTELMIFSTESGACPNKSRRAFGQVSAEYALTAITPCADWQEGHSAGCTGRAEVV